MVNASPALARFPNLPARSRFHVGYSDRPRLSSTLRAEWFLTGCRRDTKKGNLLTVRRPCRLLVEIHAWVKVAESLLRETIDADKAVVFAVAHEGQFRAIRRPP